MSDDCTNVILAGLARDELRLASEILARTGQEAGFEVAQCARPGGIGHNGLLLNMVQLGLAEQHQTIPEETAHFLIALTEKARIPTGRLLRKDGIVIAAETFIHLPLDSIFPLNAALLGVLSTYLPIEEKAWQAAFIAQLSVDSCDRYLQAFTLGRNVTP